jgi:hypothetical protein
MYVCSFILDVLDTTLLRATKGICSLCVNDPAWDVVGLVGAMSTIGSSTRLVCAFSRALATTGDHDAECTKTLFQAP